MSRSYQAVFFLLWYLLPRRSVWLACTAKIWPDRLVIMV